MKLYFSPGACSMSCHIVLEETQTPFELIYIKENDETLKTFRHYNPLGAVPALVLDNGKVITQNSAILEFIADKKPEFQLLDKAGTWERIEIMRWLSLISSDLHKSFSPLFRLDSITSISEAKRDIKNWCFTNIDKYLSLINLHLENNQFLAHDRFTIADAYLFTSFQWTKLIDFSTDDYPALNAYSDNIANRPAVKKVLEREQKFIKKS